MFIVMFRWLRVPVVLLFAALAFSHPMGNFSVNHYTRLEPGAEGLVIRYTLDLAEVPTLELLRQWGESPGGRVRGERRRLQGRRASGQMT